MKRKAFVIRRKRTLCLTTEKHWAKDTSNAGWKEGQRQRGEGVGKQEARLPSAPSFHTSKDTFPVSPFLPLHGTPTALNFPLPTELYYTLGPRRNGKSTATATTSPHGPSEPASFHRAEVLFTLFPDTKFCATYHPSFGTRIFWRHSPLLWFRRLQTGCMCWCPEELCLHCSWRES